MASAGNNANSINDVLSYLSYDNMTDGTTEVLTSDKWDFEFTKVPNAVYFPGMSNIRKRLKGIPSGLGMEAFQHAPLSDIMIRGFAIPAQPGRIDMRNTTVTLDFLDYEDQSIYVMLSDWLFKCCDPVTMKGYRAEDLRAEMKFTRLNTLDQPVRSYLYRNVLIESFNYMDQFDGDSRQPVGQDVSASFTGALMPPHFENLNAV